MKATYTLALGLIGSLLELADATSKHGVIGFGISMYKPVCCYACHDSLSSLHLSCTTFSDETNHDGMSMRIRKRMDMGGDSVATTNDSCYASDKVWLETFAYCVQSKCSDNGIDESKQNKCFANLAANGESVPSLQNAMPTRKPTAELGEEDMWLNVTSLVNEEIYTSNQRTLSEFEASEDRHTRYALIVMLFVVGTCLLAGVWNRLEYHLPSHHAFASLQGILDQYLFVPALFGKRHLQPLPHKSGYIPKRGCSLFIAAYVILNILFSSVSFHHVSPNVWYSSRRDEIAAYVSNRTGVLSFANLALAILFSGRNNILIAVTGWSQSSMIAIHRWSARVATVQAVVHSIIYTVKYFWSGGAAAYYAEAAQAYYWWGIIATVVLCFGIAFAVLPFRLWSYELFLVTHITFAILALIGCWYHIRLRFASKWGYEVWLYVAFAFWGADRAIRFLRLAFYNRRGASKGLIEQIPNTDILELTVSLAAPWNVGPGQHSFLYIPSLGKPWENHPFTIAKWGNAQACSGTSTPGEVTEAKTSVTQAVIDLESSASSDGDDPNQITLLVRARSGMTSSLQRSLSPGTSLPLSVLTEGPYGGHRSTLLPLRTADTILCIAGGVGITSSMGFLQQYLSSDDGSSNSIIPMATHFVLAWSAREESLLRHLTSSHLPSAETTQRKSLDYRFWCTGAVDDAATAAKHGFGQGRMDVGHVVRSVAEGGGRCAVLVCAPGAMADEARAAVVACLGDGLRVALIEEGFAW